MNMIDELGLLFQNLFHAVLENTKFIIYYCFWLLAVSLSTLSGPSAVGGSLRSSTKL